MSETLSQNNYYTETNESKGFKGQDGGMWSSSEKHEGFI